MTTFAPASTSARQSLKSVNPATGEMVGQVPITPVDQVPAIVARARAAQPAWRALGPQGRAAKLAPAGAKIVARAEELGRLLTSEMGKPLAEAIAEVTNVGTSLEGRLKDIAAALEPDTLEND